MKHTSIAIISLSLVCLSVSGCSHPAEPVPPAPVPVGTASLPNMAFLSALRSVSPAQRQAYVQQHPDQVSQIMRSPNSMEKTEYTLLMQTK